MTQPQKTPPIGQTVDRLVQGRWGPDWVRQALLGEEPHVLVWGVTGGRHRPGEDVWLPRLTEGDVLAVLHAVERGEVSVPEEQRQRARGPGFGLTEYHLPNGWRFTVYVDADCWDYIEEVHTPEGRSLDFLDISGGDISPLGMEPMRRLYGYRPPREMCEAYWGLKPS